MSWLFSQALVEEYSGGISSGGEPFAQLNMMPTPQQFSRNGKPIDCSGPSLFGLTLQLLTADHGEAVLMSYLAAFPARTSAPPGKELASKASGQGSGWKWRESFAKWSRPESMWKTRQCSLLGDSDVFSETWPRWGSMRDGECLEQSTLAPHTSGNASGSWPTPHGFSKDGRSNGPSGNELGRAVNRSMRPTPNVPNGGRSVAHAEQIGNSFYHKGKKVQFGLESAVRLWPTPVATDGSHGGRVTPRKAREGGNLIEAVSARTIWAIPTVQGSKNNGAPSQMERNSLPLNAQVGGSLNPDWVEWLMGWPIGWTDLKPLAMDRFQEWLQQHGDSWLDPRGPE